MHVVLLALGLVMSVAGIVLIGFGIPINTASLGNTLIIAGTIAIVGGLILIGLASAILQLRRIAQVLETRPVPRALGPEPAETAPRVHAPVPTPSPPPQPRVDAEPERPPATGPELVPAAAEQPAAPAERAPEPQPAMADEEKPPSPATMPRERKAFDTIWTGEPASASPSDIARTDAATGAVTEPAPSEQRATEPPAAAPPSQGVQIFKSGVIDGMAYTLYTDGSIEAELAQGTVKFASIDELRAYLAARET